MPNLSSPGNTPFGTVPALPIIRPAPAEIPALYRQESATVGSVTTVSSAESIDYSDAATVESFTSLTGSYIMETFTIHTTDYDWNPWSTAYSFDGSIPVTGSVGAFDNDNGLLT